MSIYSAKMYMTDLNNIVVNNPFINHSLKREVSQAIDLAISALSTIEDGNYVLKSKYYADTDSAKTEMKCHLNAEYGKLVQDYIKESEDIKE